MSQPWITVVFSLKTMPQPWITVVFCWKMMLRAAPGCSPGCSWLSLSAAPTASDADFAITSSLAVTSVTFCGRETLASSCHSDASFDVMTPPGACVLIQRKPTLFHRFRGVPGGEVSFKHQFCIKYNGILLFWLKMSVFSYVVPPSFYHYFF